MDYASATPVDVRVRDVMEPYFSRSFGNAGSIHAEGVQARDALEGARKCIARTLGARISDIMFTSGGTEANNLAILGVARALEGPGPLHMVTTTIEHPSILNCFKRLEENGVSVTYVPASESGVVSPHDIEKALTPRTVLVSVMYANNEIGTVQPISRISKIVHCFKEKRDAELPLYMHTDASQAPLYLDCSVQKLQVDLMTFDAQKIYGPKGVGALYKKHGVVVSPLFEGGGQEYGIRPGTENIPLIVGFAEALSNAQKEYKELSEKTAKLRDYFIRSLIENVPSIVVNGDADARIANNINVSIPGHDAEFLVISLDADGIACGTGSACTRGKDSSYVVEALGGGEAFAKSSLRFSLGKKTTEGDIDRVVSVLRARTRPKSNI